jgi:hypothetical protein
MAISSGAEHTGSSIRGIHAMLPLPPSTASLAGRQPLNSQISRLNFTGLSMNLEVRTALVLLEDLGLHSQEFVQARRGIGTP